MPRFAKRILSLVMALCLTLGTVELSFAESPAPQPQSVDGFLTRASEDMRDARWSYYLNAEGYAVVSGYDGPSVTALSIPLSLGGHDVAAIGSLAFESTPALSTLVVHGSVRAIAKDAFAGLASISLRAYNGSRALAFAKENGLGAVNRSTYDFVETVVDMTDLPADRARMNADGTVNFSALDGGRLAVGSVFFAPNLDAKKAFMVSTLANTADGVCVSVTEATGADVLTQVVIHETDIAPDWANAVWADGVTSVGLTGGNASVSTTEGFSVELAYKKKFGDVELKIAGILSYTAAVDVDVTLIPFRKNKIRTTLTDNSSITVSLSGKLPNAIDIPICDVPFHSSGIETIYLEMRFKVSVEGKLELKLEVKKTTGVEYVKATDTYRQIQEGGLTPSLNGSVAVKMELVPAFGINVLFVGDILSFGASISAEAKVSATLETPFCCDLSITVKCALFVKSEIFSWSCTYNFYEVTLLSAKWHAEWQPLMNVWTIVPSCSRGDGSSFTVSFDDRSGNDPIEQSVISGWPACELEPAAKNGFTFTGWFTDADCTKRWDFNTPLYADLDLYAGWEDRRSEIWLYDAVNGNKVVAAQMGEPLSDYITALNRAKGYRFVDWCSDVARTQSVDIAAYQIDKSPLELYARWVPEEDYDAFMETLIAETVARKGLAFELTDDESGYKVIGYTGDSEYVSIPSTYNGLPVKEIGEYAFEGNEVITRVTIPDSVFKISDGAFDGCTFLRDVTFGKNIELCPWSFNGCSSLTSVYLPVGVQMVWGNPFAGCENLSKITIDKNHPYLEAIDNVLFNKERRAILCYPAGLTQESYTVPAGTKEIDAYSFNHARIKTIRFTTGLTDIQWNAFTDAQLLDGVVIPDGVTYVGGFAFEGCDSLTWVQIPASVRTDMPAWIFGSHNVVPGGSEASSSQIEPIVYGYTGSFIEYYLNLCYDGGYPYFVSIGIADPPYSPLVGANTVSTEYPEFTYTLSELGEATITACSAMTAWDATIPAELDGYPVVAIGERAFAEHPALEYVSFPASLRSIEAYAFYNCEGLTEITFPATLTEIDEDAFLNCDLTCFGPLGDCAARQFARKNLFDYNLYTVEYVLNGKTLYREATEAGDKLRAGYTPEAGAASFVGWYTEREAGTLWDYENDVMPEENVTLYARFSTDYLYEVNEAGDAVTIIGYIGDRKALDVPATLDGLPVTAIAADAFPCAAAAPWESVTIPATVTDIGERAVSNAVKIVGDAGTAAETYAAANGIPFEKKLYTLAFDTAGGAPIASIQAAAGDQLTLPTPVRDNYHFYGWFYDSLLQQQATIEDTMPRESLMLCAFFIKINGSIPDSPYTVTYGDGEAEIAAYTGSDVFLTIPDTINGFLVTSIGRFAFAENRTLAVVTVPAGVARIGYAAFSGSSVGEVILPAGAQMDEAVFSGCRGLYRVVLPSGLTAIPAYTFQNCAGLTNMTLDKGITQIGACAFYGCAYMKTFYAGNTLAQIGADAFDACGRLTLSGCAGSALATYAAENGISFHGFGMDDVPEQNRLTLPASLAEISEEAFMGGAMSAVIIRQNAQSIGARAFKGCASLRFVVIPASVQSIGADAFAGCGSLIILCHAGSAAETYARANGFEYSLLP